LLEQQRHARRILRDLRIQLRVSTFQPRVRDHSRSAMPWSAHVEHVEIVFYDHAIAMRVDEIQTGSGAPVPQKSGFYVLRTQRFPQQRIALEVDLSHRKIIGSAPIRI